MKMDDVIRPANLDITTLSPIHIGSGDTYSPKFYHYIEEDKLIHVVSQQKLLREIALDPNIQQRTEFFVAFCEEQNTTFKNLLNQWDIPLWKVSAYTLLLEKTPNDNLKSILSNNDRSFRNSRSNKVDLPDIRAFIRRYDGEGPAYFPGSSLKGAIRSAMLRFAYMSDKDLQTNLKHNLANYDKIDADNSRKAIRKQVEQRFFSNIPVGQPDSKASNYDLLRLLSISDSGPIKNDKLFVAPVFVYSSQTDEVNTKWLKPKPFITYVEALQPETSFIMPFGVNRYLRSEIAGSVLPPGKQNFIDSCREVGKTLAQQELAFYDYHIASDDLIAKHMSTWFNSLLNQISKLPKTEAILPIGWGSGYDAKTITDLIGNTLMERVTSKDTFTYKLGRPSRSNDMLPDPLVPKTRRIVNYKNTRYPMGWLKLTLR